MKKRYYKTKKSIKTPNKKTIAKGTVGLGIANKKSAIRDKYNLECLFFGYSVATGKVVSYDKGEAGSMYYIDTNSIEEVEVT